MTGNRLACTRVVLDDITYDVYFGNKPTKKVHPAGEYRGTGSIDPGEKNIELSCSVPSITPGCTGSPVTVTLRLERD